MRSQTSRILSAALVVVSLFAGMMGIVFGLLFYRLYLIWIPLFEEGRYFDPESNVVYSDAAVIHGIMMLASILVTVAAAAGILKLRRRRSDRRIER